jgi:DNA replication protein DnaC
VNVAIKLKTRTDTCDRHGEYLARNFIGKVWSNCPACTAEHDAAQQAKAEADAREAKLRAWHQRIGQAGIPERFQSRSLDNFEAATDAQRHALAFARKYAEGFDAVIETGRSALFIGKPGTGKTHLAVGIGMHLMGQKRTVLFTTVMRAIRRVKDSWARESTATESQAIAALVFPDLLILDEVGVQFGSEFEKNMLFDVLNERYEKRRPTLLMSNLPIEEVRAYLGERVFDRMREDGGQYIAFEWESHRAKVGKA